MGIADDPSDAGKGGELFGGSLGVTASDDEASGRVLRVDLADGVASLSIGSGSDRAGIENDDVCCGGSRSGGATAFEELALEGSAVCLGGAAAELLDEKGGHTIPCLLKISRISEKPEKRLYSPRGVSLQSLAQSLSLK